MECSDAWWFWTSSNTLNTDQAGEKSLHVSSCSPLGVPFEMIVLDTRSVRAHGSMLRSQLSHDSRSIFKGLCIAPVV